MNDKEKLLKKTKLIFFVEYIAIAVVLIVIGLLRIFDIIPYNPQRLLAYNIITLVGVAYVFFDFTWFLVSKKKRAKSDLIDKIFPVPLAIFLLVFDIMVLAKQIEDINFIKYCIAGVLMYGAAIALFLGIYHFINPSKMLLAAVEEEYAEKLQEADEEKAKENSETSETPENKE